MQAQGYFPPQGQQNLGVQSQTTGASRPSSAGSTQPLNPAMRFGVGPGTPSHAGHTLSTGSISSPPVSVAGWSAAGGAGYAASDTGTNSSGYPISGSGGGGYGQQGRLQVTNFVPADQQQFGQQQQQQQQNMVLDEKGRLKMTADAAPIVHTDGGRLDQSGAGPSNHPPPAYEA